MINCFVIMTNQLILLNSVARIFIFMTPLSLFLLLQFDRTCCVVSLVISFLGETETGMKINAFTRTICAKNNDTNRIFGAIKLTRYSYSALYYQKYIDHCILNAFFFDNYNVQGILNIHLFRLMRHFLNKTVELYDVNNKTSIILRTKTDIKSNEIEWSQKCSFSVFCYKKRRLTNDLMDDLVSC